MVGGTPLKSTYVVLITRCGEQIMPDICVPMRPSILSLPQLLCYGSTSVKWVLHCRFFCRSPTARPWRQRLLHLEARHEQTRRIHRGR